MLRLELASTPTSVGTARRRACDEVRVTVPDLADVDGLADDVALVVSELVTNAIVHGVPPVTLEVSVDRGAHGCVVTVVCCDSGPWDGTPPEPIRGRGLILVRALADASIAADTDGTRVSATLHR